MNTALPLKNTVPPEDAAVILRAQRLRFTVHSDGWQDVEAVLEAIERNALDKIRSYKGTDREELASLTFIWKTAETVCEQFKATIEDAIEKGTRLLAHYQANQNPTQGPDQPILSATVVKPLCDLRTEAEENAERSEQESD